MWTLLLVLACGTRAPDGVPEGAVRLTVDEGDLQLDGEPVGPWSAVADHPLHNAHDPLTHALRAHAARPLWLELPGQASWFELRKLVNSAEAAGIAQLVVSVAGTRQALPLPSPPQFDLAGTCPGGPLTVLGATPLVTLSLQTGADGAWIVGTARFLPVVELHGARGPVDGLPMECLTVPPCATLFAHDEAERAACEGEGEEEARERVRLGGPNGCLLPIAREPADVAKWTAELPGLVTQLGLVDQELLMLMPEARTRLDALVAVLEGFRASERPVPAVGATLLIQGNDGPPVCNAPVRDAASLSAAGARWLGALGGE